GGGGLELSRAPSGGGGGGVQVSRRPFRLGPDALEPEPLARRPEVGGGRDELVEQLAVLALLRMPEHAEGEAMRRILDRLDHSVLRVRRDAQSRADAAEP